MIFDTLAQADRYHGLGAPFAAAFAYLKQTDLTQLPVGRVAINGTDLFALVVDEPTRLPEACRWEAHRQYNDVQYVVAGEEVMGYAPRETMREVEPAGPDNDYAFYEGEGQYVKVTAGQFVVFFPGDVHRPSMALGRPARVRKVVLKVRLA